MAYQADASFARGSAASIVVDVPAIPLFVPAQARAALESLVQTTIRLALHEVAGRVSEHAPVNTGALAQSFGADPATQVGGIEMLGGTLLTDGISGHVFSVLPYAIVMELGRLPGSPISRVGVDAIGLWAQRKLGLSADQAAHVKWAIAARIVARGIAGKHYFQQGLDAASPRIEEMFKILNENIASALTTEGQTH